MDNGSLIGNLLTIGLVAYGILGTGVDLSYYWDAPSLAIVLGGTVGCLFYANKLETSKKISTFFGLTFKGQGDLEKANIDIIKKMIEFSERARKEGLLALEDTLEEITDKFMRAGLQLVVDGTDSSIIRTTLYNEVTEVESRHEEGIALMETMGSMAPAFGMIGTLIGLIAMLANLSDSAGLASGMATALITTMYGSMVANMFAIPAGKKLAANHTGEMLTKQIVIEAVLSIQSGDNPRILQQKLSGFLSPKGRVTLNSEVDSK